MANPIIFPNSAAGNPCLLTQTVLDERFKGLDPSNQSVRYGMLNALNSEKNRSANNLAVSQGKERPSETNKTVTARYLTYICETSDLSSIDKCNLGEGEKPLYKSANYVIDDQVIHKFSMDQEDFRKMCETPTEQFTAWLSMNINEFLRKWDKKLLASAIPLMGNYPIGVNAGTNSVTTPLTVNTLSANGTYQPIALALVQEQYEAMGIFGRDPIIVGKGSLSLAEKIRAFSGVNQNGTDTTFTGGLDNVFIDDLIDRYNLSAGASRLLTWAPGALQLMTWLEFTGNYSETKLLYTGQGNFPSQMAKFERQWITLEVLPGLEVDFLYEKTCEGIHTWALKSDFALVSLPEDSFANCQDFNYALNFIQGCGNIDCTAINNFITES